MSGENKDIQVWHPIEDIRSVAERMCRAFDVDSPGRRGNGKARRFAECDRIPSLVERDGKFVVTLELPEVAKKDLHVNVSEATITIFAAWTKSKTKASPEAARIEQFYTHQVRLPAPGKAGQARATFKDRVLKIFVPRAEPSRVRRIDVS